MVSEVEVESVKRQVDIFKQLKKSVDAQDLASYDKVEMYKQMRKQLHANMKRYSKEGKGDLARIISRSLAA
ncbi:MAG: hypothetical protein ABI348_01500 [Nitrososphaera sp.]